VCTAALRAFEGRLEAERDRLALWLVPGIGAGILIYFALPDEPPLRAGLLAVLGAAIAFRFARGARLILEAGAVLILSMALGFLAAEIRTRIVSAPILPHEIGLAPVEGRLLSVDAGSRGRVKGLFAVSGIEGQPPIEWPARIRISFRPGSDALIPGASYRLRAVLKPPEGPVAPGAYDFARRAYFDEIGATGFALAPPERLPGVPASDGLALLERLREGLAARIASRVDGAASGVSVALVTGLRTDIPKEAETDLRNSGLYHLISISGVHMSVVALGLFFTLRLLLALLPALALRFPIKKWAAGLTILGTFAYLMFTGAGVATIRSFVMVALVFLAVIADRRALTMRNVALAAALILIVLPESVLDPGFQMSFAATAGLIALYENWRGNRGEGFSLARIGPYFLAIVLSGLVAGIATAPFSIFHFQSATPLSLIANLVAIPVTDLVVMPAACLVYVLAPLGLDGPAIWLLGQGCALILLIAKAVAALPGAVQGIAAGPPAALLLIVFAGLWLVLWRTMWRGLAVAPALAGLWLWVTAPTPDVLIDRTVSIVALRDASGRLGLIHGRGGSYEASTWLKRDGVQDATRRAEGRRCDALGCVAPLAAGGLLAVSEDPASLDEDCATARILISTGAVRRPCTGPALVIDRRQLAKLGPIAVFFREGSPEILLANPALGSRPWTPQLRGAPVRSYKLPEALLSTAE
jgi:competence protein ComEC